MTGPKLNEKNFVAGERSGTKASAKYVRSSARKARVVLDLIRDLPATRADQVLQFTDREIARTIRKVLASAVANAVNNDAQDAEELYVKACFADEGPTLRRFRPRARGRATRIRKRTCHITIVLDRMSEQQLAVQQAKSERGGRVSTSSAASRRARVEASRQRAAARKGGDAVETVADQPTHDEVVEATEAAVAAGEWAGSALPLEDGSAPEGFAIKGNADSMLYHVPGGPSYKVTKAEVYFDTVESAEAAGFSAPGDDEDNETAADAGDAEETN